MASTVSRTPISGPRGKVIKAFTLSRGVGVGRAFFLPDTAEKVERRRLSQPEIEKEIERFSATFERCRGELASLAADPSSNVPPEASAIFDAQLLMLETSPIKEHVLSNIRDYSINAEWALEKVREQFHRELRQVADPVFREKIGELDDVISRLRTALGPETKTDLSITSRQVVVLRDAKTSRFYDICEYGPAGLIVEHGGWTSHISIIAREFGIPMVSGLGDPFSVLTEGEFVVVDGDAGEVVITGDHPISVSADATSDYPDSERPGASLRTTDDIEVTLLGNADGIGSVKRSLIRGASGIGLFRTDGLITSQGIPRSEEEQYHTYNEVLSAAGGRPVTFRTFDFGVDPFGQMGSEPNPALGLRSLRICLSRPEIFQSQLRALFRAAGNRQLRLLIPMVSGVADLISARRLIEEVRNELTAAELDVTAPLVGVMVELPSAVLTIDSLADEADFLCIGTNDLVQYLLGADRDNELVASWYQSLHPAVLRSLASVHEAASDRNKPVTICGEMASAPFYLPILLGLGYRGFSMHSRALANARRLVSHIAIADCLAIAHNALQFRSADKVEQFLLKEYTNTWGNLFPAGILERSAEHLKISET